MLRILLIILAILAALLQALSFPWINLFGTQVSFLLVTMFLCSKRFTKLLPGMGVAGGLALDFVSATPFGLWALYYFCVGFMFRLLLDKSNVRWWWSLTWLSAAIAFNPLYAQAMSGQINLVHWLPEAIWPTVIVTTIALWPSWLLRKLVEREL